MTERYDAVSAVHYAAYRPPLHSVILGRTLSAGEVFNTGLDMGSGTGYSAVGLAEYCAHVFAIDPSLSMLDRAITHERVSYLRARAEQIPLPDDSVEIITFAGSLSYCDPEPTREEIRRIGREGAVVIAYDFEVLLTGILEQLGVDSATQSSDYDHRANFSGAPGFTERVVESERIGVPVTPTELAHVLLSDSGRLDQLTEHFRSSDPFSALRAALRAESTPSSIEADLYYSAYQLTA